MTTENNRYTILALCSATFLYYHANRVFISPILPLIRDEYHLSYSQVGWVAAAYEIGFAATLILSGYLGDRYRRKMLIIFGLFLSIIAMFLVGQVKGFYTLLILRMLAGIGFSTYFSSGFALIAEYFNTKERGKAVGIHSSGSSAGRFVGPLVAGIVANSFGWKWSFYVLGVYAFLVLISFTVLVKHEISHKTVEDTRGSIKEFLEIIKNRIFISLCVIFIFSMTYLLSGSIYIPVYLVAVMGMNVKTAGILGSIPHAFAIISGPLIGTLSDKIGRQRTLILIFGIASILMYLFILSQSIIITVILLVALGFVLHTSNPVLFTYVTEIVPPRARGMVIGLFNTVGIVSGSIALVLSGKIADLAGVVYIFYFIILITLGGLASSIILLKK